MELRCSSCSKRVLPIVVSDIDGTLAQYHETIAGFCGQYFDKAMPVMLYDGTVPFRDYLGITQAQHRAMKLAYRQGGFKRFVPMYPGADELINDVRMLGAEVWVATTRPYQRLDNIDPDTQEWLRRNRIHVDGLLYGEDKYAQLVGTVNQDRIVACFEDLPIQLDIGHQLGLPMFRVSRSHNVDVSGAPWATPGGNLRQAFVFARNRLVAWENAHE